MKRLHFHNPPAPDQKTASELPSLRAVTENNFEARHGGTENKSGNINTHNIAHRITYPDSYAENNFEPRQSGTENKSGNKTTHRIAHKITFPDFCRKQLWRQLRSNKASQRITPTITQQITFDAIILTKVGSVDDAEYDACANGFLGLFAC